MIVGDYKNWTGEQLFPTKSSFTIRGYEYEFKKWEIEEEEKPEKLLFNLWMVEPSPEHPAVMGKLEMYDGINFVYVNPYFEGGELERITLELKKAAGQELLSIK